MDFNFAVIADNLDYLIWGRTFSGELGGLFLTVLMALTAGVLSLALGLGLAFTVRLGPKPLGHILTALADLVRSIPLIFVIFWIYFLVPALFRTEVPGFLSVVIALAWFSSGAVMHSTLSGLDALPRGHREAGLASGLTEGQVFRDILLPQAMRNLIPSYVALFASMIKDTSLAFIMNVPELTMTANQVNSRVQVYPAEIFLFIAAVYFILCASLSWLAGRLASRLKPGRVKAKKWNLIGILEASYGRRARGYVPPVAGTQSSRNQEVETSSECRERERMSNDRSNRQVVATGAAK